MLGVQRAFFGGFGGFRCGTGFGGLGAGPGVRFADKLRIFYARFRAKLCVASGR